MDHVDIRQSIDFPPVMKFNEPQVLASVRVLISDLMQLHPVSQSLSPNHHCPYLGASLSHAAAGDRNTISQLCKARYRLSPLCIMVRAPEEMKLYPLPVTIVSLICGQLLDFNKIDRNSHNGS